MNVWNIAVAIDCDANGSHLRKDISTVAKHTGNRFAAALFGTALILTAAPATAAAAAPASTSKASLSIGKLVLEPTERGYQGSLPITVTNKGSAETYFNVVIVEPIAGSFRSLSPGSPCIFRGLVENRRIIGCDVPDPTILQPGEKRSFSVEFQALTTRRDIPMIADGGQISVIAGNGSAEIADQEDFSAHFRSTSGSLGNPVPYVQDPEAKASISAAGNATLVPQADGSYLGRLPVTVRWAGDAAHDFLFVDATSLPAGVQIWGTDPQDDPSFLTSFWVPGGRFMAGEERTFDVLLHADAGTMPGDMSNAAFQLSTKWASIVVADTDPADNTTTFTVTAADAS